MFLFSKLNEIVKSTEALLNDVVGYKKFNNNTQNIIAEMKKAEQECYQDWCENTLSNIDDPKSNIRLFELR